ncbi:helix-turn-helix domain-containing protein [Selenomonas ruminantium]|uniref:Helix-turn-helix n=1 Tax=Selenomonas ruminantium TaxID=971 RepID=A0A1I0YRB2_SELRU|nr:helix-turn-helix transcriptional regulator [Selenomonas ruminantium]SFB15752.1 Helix-turn-helix [Selenomonas ruminantium]
MRFNETLKELREERGISRQEMATYLGISLQAYSNYEKESEPRYATLEKIADKFNVSIDRLMGYKPKVLKGCLKQFYKYFDYGSYVKPDAEEKGYVEVYLNLDYTAGRLSMPEQTFIDMCVKAESEKGQFAQAFINRFFREYGIAMGIKHKADMAPLHEVVDIEEPVDTSDPNDFLAFGIELE